MSFFELYTKLGISEYIKKIQCLKDNLNSRHFKFYTKKMKEGKVPYSVEITKHYCEFFTC